MTRSTHFAKSMSRNPRTRFGIALAAAFALLCMANNAVASDGELEINQTCATQTGCFPGDTAGFPVTITSAGSYRLTSNLRQTTLLGGSQDDDFIEISADEVSLNLGGFQITCTSLLGGSCSGTGSGVASSPTIRGTSVRNGSVSGMGRNGISIGEQAEVVGVRAGLNDTTGILVGLSSTVSGSTVYANGSNGMIAGAGSTVSGSTARENGGVGIAASFGSTVSESTAHSNIASGIAVSLGSTASGNSAYLNGGDGISAGDGCTIIGNTAYENGDTTNPTQDDGIQCMFGCLVRDNTVRRNKGYGLNVSTDSAYGGNVVSFNTTGTVTGGGSGNTRGNNFCAGTGTVSAFCP